MSLNNIRYTKLYKLYITLVVIMILKGTATFQVLFTGTVSLFCAWNISTVEINEINSGEQEML